MIEGVSRKIAKDFHDKIKTGQWPAGKRVPTTRQLAAQYQVSVNTIQNAFRELEASDLVERRPRLGGFVKARPKVRIASAIAVVGPYTTEGLAASEADEPHSWGYRIIRGCDAELGEANIHVSMFSYPPGDPNPIPKILAKIDQALDSLGGILLFPRPETAALRDELDRRNIPWVTVNRPREHAAQNFVSAEVVLPSRLVARCFAKLKVRRAVFLCNCLSIGNSTNDKYLGFMQGWLESGMPSRDVDFISCGNMTESVGYEHIKPYLDSQGVPDAIFAAGDLLALGALRALRERNVNVGTDTFLVGSTGLQLATYANPPLTVIQTPMEQMGREAARMLLEMHREGVRRMIGRYVASPVVVRDSCPISPELLDRELKQIEQEV
ncbi:MAG TPA: substrate-binding domain-containing protein [Tepidisphaeraceae bacterium]|jgi:DNA-binding LacI/PurR family transcriptional regulator|nr:substrate-binding domain-containing protein [Tepidisphaeraceae bacterium]